MARRDNSIPYDAFDEAIERMKVRFPEAVKFTRSWYNREIYIEVWFADGHAKVVPAHEE